VTAAGTAPALAASLAAVDELITWCSFRLGLPDGADLVSPAHSALRAGDWVRCSDALADPLFFPTWHTLLAARLAGQYSSVPPVTPPGYVMGWYAGLFGYLGGALFHLTRRVPSLAPENLAFRLDPRLRRPAEVALLDDSFGCLPDDPAAGCPPVSTLAGEQALASLLRAQVAGHGSRFVAAFRPSARFGWRTLWGVVTDSLDGGLLYAGRARGRPGAGAADALLVLPARIRPFTSASTVRPVDGEQWTRERQSCCFHYKLPEVQRPCATCPRLSG
jgi:hypothetical protein